MRHGLKLSLGAAGAFAIVLAGAGVGVLGTAIGRLRLCEFLLSSALQRPVRMSAMTARVFSTEPSFHAEDMVVASPADITKIDLLHARNLDATMDWSELIRGHLSFRALSLDHPDLHLVRLAPGRNNFTFGGGEAGGALRHVSSLSATGGHLIYEDPPRHLLLDGAFNHDREGGAQALRLQGGGVANGQPFAAVAVGAAFNGRRPGDPYAFSAHMVDGGTDLVFAGTTWKPFDFRAFDLTVQAKGPNLADLHYLFGVDPVNSPPFEARGHASKADHVTRFTGMVGRVGATDLVGDITGDDRGPRRKISARLKAGSVHLNDVAALLNRAPDHAHGTQRARPQRSGERRAGA